MNTRILRLYSIIKTAGPKERKTATGINFDAAEAILKQDGGIAQPTRDQIKAFITERANELPINKEALDGIEKMDLGDDFRKILNQDEAFAIIVGCIMFHVYNGWGFHAQKLNEDLKDFLMSKGINQPGKLMSSEFMTGVNLKDPKSMKDKFSNLYEATLEQAVKDAREAQSASGKTYVSDDVVFDFDDKWKVVYIPAAGQNDMPEFPGISGSSHDRMIEGNKNGLCLGSNQRLYQNNDGGTIYSVRNLSNEPEVTIRIKDGTLMEAKGKNNLSPDAEGAIHAKIWFESIDGLNYKTNGDYIRFPPTSKEEAVEKFTEEPDMFLTRGNVVHWYKNGILEIDALVERVINASKKEPFIPENYERYEEVPMTDEDLPMYFTPLLLSGLGKKHKELMEPLIIAFCKRYITSDNLGIFGSRYATPETISHESWKTYRKLPIMRAAVNKLCEHLPERVLQLGLPKIEEYASDGKKAILSIINDIDRPANRGGPEYFIDTYGTAYPEYLNLAKEKLAESNGERYIHRFLGENAELDDIAHRSYAKKNPTIFIRHAKKESVPYLGLAWESAAKTAPIWFIENYSTNFNKHLIEPHMEYRVLAYKSLAKKDPKYYLRKCLEAYMPEYTNDITDELVKTTLDNANIQYPTGSPEYFDTQTIYALASYVFIGSEDPDKGPKIFLDLYGKSAPEDALIYARSRMAQEQEASTKQSSFLSLLKTKVGMK